MKISDKIAELNWNRNLNFETPFNPNNARPALFTFDGDVYSGIDSFTLSENNIKKAQASLRILSGLYGLLKPLDLMQAYRLEMGTKLVVGSSKNLYEFWNNKITNSLNRELDINELLINLASNEYSAVINKDLLKVDMISPVFKDFKNGKFKIISLKSLYLEQIIDKIIPIQNKFNIKTIRPKQKNIKLISNNFL